jgi:hypothetical protein
MTGPVVHPLLQEAVVGEIERAGSEHRGSRWVCGAFTDLDDLASHSCGVFHGEPFSVFAKLSDEANAVEQFTAELAGLKLLRDSAQVATPTPIGTGVVRLPVGSLLKGSGSVSRTASSVRCLRTTIRCRRIAGPASMPSAA